MEEEEAREDILKQSLFTYGVKPTEIEEELRDYLLNSILDISLKRCLSIYNWGFNTYTEKLEMLIEYNNNNNKYKYCYKTPLNFLKLQDIYKDKEELYTIKEYKLRNDLLFSNEEDIYMKYSKLLLIIDLPYYFIDYLKYDLASESMLYMMGTANDYINIIENKKLQTFKQAKVLDTSEKPNYIFKSNPYIEIRE
jgi:hypothetical protein